MFDPSHAPSDKQAPWSATIDRSWSDATSGTPGPARDVAARWFREAGSYFRRVCERAGLDPETVQARATEALDRLGESALPKLDKVKLPKVQPAGRGPQSANGRFPKLVEFDGQALTIAAWCERLGMSRTAINARIRNGQPLTAGRQTPGRKPGSAMPSRTVTLNDDTLTLAEWLKRTGVSKTAFYRRLKQGWSVERALTTPPTPPNLRYAGPKPGHTRKHVRADDTPGVGRNFAQTDRDRRGSVAQDFA